MDMRNDDDPPYLQALVRRAGERYARELGEVYDPRRNPEHGGYQHITPQEWAEWDRLNAEWQARRRERYQKRGG
jgi:hypothetical protein